MSTRCDDSASVKSESPNGDRERELSVCTVARSVATTGRLRYSFKCLCFFVEVSLLFLPCVLIAAYLTPEYLLLSKPSTLLTRCCFREKDARWAALDVLGNETAWNRYHAKDRALEELKLSLELQDHDGKKATAATLFCMNQDKQRCAYLRQAIVRRLKADGHERCLLFLEANGHHYDDLAGETQLKLVKTLQACSRPVVIFEKLERVSLGEVRALHNAISERGAFIDHGKSYPANEALYLFSMHGDIVHRSKGIDKLLPVVRDQVQKKIVGNDSSLATTGAAFRRRINAVFPITDIDVED